MIELNDDFFITELAFFTTKLAFFTTEHTENHMRATEDYHCLGELRALRKFLCGALSLPLVVAVLRGPPPYLRVLRGEKSQRLAKKASSLLALPHWRYSGTECNIPAPFCVRR